MTTSFLIPVNHPVYDEPVILNFIFVLDYSVVIVLHHIMMCE